MQKRLMNALFTAATLFTVAGCSSHQAVETTDGKTIVTHEKPDVDTHTGMVSYTHPPTGKTPKTNPSPTKN
ncbi:YgdI/YgdR family lipoprotein, partial [Salmonella enterica]|uniref:YgdI/YgdR family lipoprotein n=1 Tax=Salmonella enterica TaxID=28901 RepID=UPI00398C32DB